MLRSRVAIGLIAFVHLALGNAQILNSERIEQTFGSYGIEVLYSDDALRVSDLYSERGGLRVTRTLAIVAYPRPLDRAYAVEHAAILDGGSIGATFQAAGWQVDKSSHRYFTASAADLAASMQVDAKTPLAIHAYRLSVSRDGSRHEYAWIIESHHPDYLRESDLIRIYGPEAAGDELEREALGLWERGRRALAESALGQ